MRLGGMILAAVFVAGCAPKTTELERAAMFIGENIVVPAAQKALEETSTRTAQMQWGAHGIEPGYTVEGEGFWCTGVKFDVSSFLKDVAGQIQSANQMDAGQPGSVQPPVQRRSREEAEELGLMPGG